MAKVSKKTLGRRRRGCLYILIILLILLFLGIKSCVGKISSSTQEINNSIVETQVATEVNTIPADTTTAVTEVTEETTTTCLTTEPPVVDELPTNSCLVEVEAVLQNPELPTGCEITSLTMALNYCGYNVDKCTMADDYLIRAEPFTTTFGEAFVGSPYDADAWGCYSPVIVKTAEKYIAAQGGTETVQNITGSAFQSLLWEVANGRPVITWVSIGLTSNIEEKIYWTTENGDAVFLTNEHCVLLTGYDLDANVVYVNDPLEGVVSYDLDMFQDRFERMYSQAVLVYQNDETQTQETTT